MTIVAVVGDRCTTTAVALAASWPVDDVVLLDADPAGGDLAAWFDLPVSPSLSTVVTGVPDGAWSKIERHVRIAPNGMRVLTGATGVGEADQAIGEASRVIAPSLASVAAPELIADTGRLAIRPSSHPFVASASVALMVHRQAPQSARAAGVRLERLAECLHLLTSLPLHIVVAVVGHTPFGTDEIERFLGASVGDVPVVGLPDDPLAAAVLAGRTGVSRRRLARLPLMRAGVELAGVVRHTLVTATERREVVT